MMKKLLGMAVLASGLQFSVVALADNHGDHDAKACAEHCEKCKHDGSKDAKACENKECDCQKHGHKHDHEKKAEKKAK